MPDVIQKCAQQKVTYDLDWNFEINRHFQSLFITNIAIGPHTQNSIWRSPLLNQLHEFDTIFKLRGRSGQLTI